MNLDTRKRQLDKLGQLKKSKFFVFTFNEIDMILGHLDTILEEHIGGYYVIGLQAIKNYP